MPIVNTNIQAIRDSNFGQFRKGETVVYKIADKDNKRVLELLKEEEQKPAFPWIILGIAFLLLRRK